MKADEEVQGEAADSQDEGTLEEDTGNQSDPEAEQNECEQIMDTLKALWAHEEKKLEGLSPDARLAAEAKVECLKLARQLLQMHLTPADPHCKGVYESAEAIVRCPGDVKGPFISSGVCVYERQRLRLL